MPQWVQRFGKPDAINEPPAGRGVVHYARACLGCVGVAAGPAGRGTPLVLGARIMWAGTPPPPYRHHLPPTPPKGVAENRGGGSPGGYRGITTPTKHPGNRFNLRVVESSTSDTAREQSRINSQHSPHMGAIWPCSSDGKSVSPIMKMSPVRVRPRPQYAIIAQLAERLICNQQVVGSSPTGSSTRLSCGLASISLCPPGVHPPHTRGRPYRG